MLPGSVATALFGRRVAVVTMNFGGQIRGQSGDLRLSVLTGRRLGLIESRCRAGSIALEPARFTGDQALAGQEVLGTESRPPPELPMD